MLFLLYCCQHSIRGVILAKPIVLPKGTDEKAMEADASHLSSDSCSYSPCYLGTMMYNGRFVPARDTSSFFLLFNNPENKMAEVPHTLRVGDANLSPISEYLCLLQHYL